MRPTLNTTKPVFDEHTLQAEVAKMWGLHGAHSEVLRMLIADSRRYRWLAASAVAGDWGSFCGWKIDVGVAGAASIETLEQAIDAAMK